MSDDLKRRSVAGGCLAALTLCAAVALGSVLTSVSPTPAPDTFSRLAFGGLLESHRDDALVIPVGYSDEDVEAARTAVRAGVTVSHQVWSAWLADEVVELDFDLDDDLVFFDTEIRTLCGVRDPKQGPFYCSVDDRIYYPDQLGVAAAERWGNWANVWFASHEYGHNIQYDSNQGVVAGESVLAWEQQADCQSGAVAGYLLDNDLITNTEIAQMIEAVDYTGDTHDVAPDSADAHGTSAERVAVFYRGLRGWSCGLESFR